MPVGVQQQVLVVTVQKTAEGPHLQFIDKVLTVPVDDFILWRLWRWGGGFRRDLRHFSHSVQLDVECPPCRDSFEPSMANSCWSSRAPLLCCGFP